jgi:glucosylceramidase
LVISKFIGKSAKRISSVASRSQLLTTSLNQDGKVVTVVMNESDVEVKYNLCRTKATEVVILPRAIQTLVY